MQKQLAAGFLLAIAATLPVIAAPKPCDELKSEIAAKLDAAGVKGYSLTVVAPDQVGEQKVVGRCEAGSKRLVYKRT